MAYKPKVLAFAGSLRKGSYNKKLVKIAIKGAERAGAEVTYIDLADYPLPIYDADLEEADGLPENALKLKKLFSSNDGLLISSPEYNSSITGALKNTIDWVSRQARPDEIYLGDFANKVCILMSASPGALGGMRSLVHVRNILENIGVIVLPDQKSIPSAMEAFGEDGNLKDPKKEAAVQALGQKLVEMLAKLKS